MYLATFDFLGDRYLQGVIRLEMPGEEAVRADAALIGLVRLIESTGMEHPGACWSQRLDLGEDRVLRRTLAVTAPWPFRDALEHALGSLQRLAEEDGLAPRMPRDAGERDAEMRLAPRCVWQLEPPRLESARWWAAYDWGMTDWLDAMFTDCCLHGCALSCISHLAPWRATNDAIGAARKNLVRLGEERGVPGNLLQAQMALSARLASATLTRSEWICCEGPVGGVCATDRILGGAPRSLIDSDLEAIRVSLARPPETVEDLAQGFSTAHLEHRPLCIATAAAETTSGAERLATWRPGSALHVQLRTATRKPPAPFGREDAPFDPYEGPGAYCFISYKRQDMKRIADCLRVMHKRGVPMWYDAGIPGGAEWAAVLENKVTKSHAVLAFLSAASMESKWCRRELETADNCGRPIIGIWLEKAEIPAGLGMRLRERQFLSFADPGFGAKLEQALALRGFLSRHGQSAGK